MKNSRMMMAEAIHEVFNETTSAAQKNAFKDIMKMIGESAFMDSLLYSISTLNPKKSLTLSAYMTRITQGLASEYVFKDIISKIDKKELPYFNTVLKNANDDFGKMLSKCNGGKTYSCRFNLLSLMMRIDPVKINGRKKIKKLFGLRKKKALIENATKKAKRIRPTILSILLRFNEKHPVFEVIETKSRKRKGANAVSLIGIDYIDRINNYMLTSPMTALDCDVQLDMSKDTTAVRSISTTLNQPHTLDSEFNKAIEAIIDTPLFDKLVIGLSTDTESNMVKVGQIRHEIKEGLGLWKDSGSGTVYFQYVIDFRGRIGQIGGISGVGNKVGKAMLRAGVKVPLGRHGYDDILIALAGAMGKDKETFNERLKWGKDNVRTYINLGNVLLHDPDRAFNELHRLGADNIWDAAAISLELHRIDNRICRIEDFESNLYIGYDATSSAVQLVGLIMGNEVLTEASNVRKGPNTADKIYDAYMLIADSMDLAAPKMDIEYSKYTEMWLSFEPKLKRAFAKPLLMTRLYGSKFLTHMRSAENVAIEKGIVDAKDTEEILAFAKAIAKLFNFAFDNEEGFNCLRGYEDFVKEVARAYAKKDVHVTWKVQDHATEEKQVVTSIYNKFSGDQYSTYFDGKKHVMRTYNLDVVGNCAGELDLTEKFELNFRKAISAIAPNYIHSHDALVLHSVVNKLQVPMRLTHDCFAIAAGQLRQMQTAINETYSELFGNNNLKQLEVLQQECYDATGKWIDLPKEYNPNGIPSEEIEAAIYKFS